MKTSTLTFLLFFLLISKISGQDKSMDNNFKWDTNFSIGKPFGPTGQDLLDNVNTLYSDSYNITTRHPGLNWAVEISHALNEHFNIGLSISMNAAFQVSSSKDYFSYNITRDNTIIIGEISSVFHYNFNKFLTWGIGPALFNIKSKNEEYVESGTLTRTNTKNLNDLYKIGFIIKSTLKYPFTKRLYTQLDLSYRYIGRADKIELDSGRLTINMRPVDIINYGYNIRMSNLYIGMGLGIRL